MKKIFTLCLAIACALIVNAQTSNLTLLGHLSYGNISCAGVWHHVDSLGNEYAIVGASDRLSIVDVTNPASPVQVASVPALPGESSLWREVKTYGNYAYAVSEGGGGIIIVDLSALPTIAYKHWYGNGGFTFNSAHTVAATDGYLYVFGSDYGIGGCMIADLVDPWNPVFVGVADQRYIHDGYVRNDTLWAGEIYQGQFSVIDVSNKSNPVYLASQPTPGSFNHNTWLSNSGQFLYTTDEISNTPVGAFDVSDVNNIQLVGVRYNDSMSTEEVHNVRVLNDYLINPSYGSQLTIWDAARPANLVEIAQYPTGNYLCWDASPYLPSGNIITTDTYGGLFIFAPTYVRACYLEGDVVDSLTGITINNVLVKILGTSKTANTNLNGEFKTGILTPGVYDIEFSKPGYITKTFSNVSLSSGVLTLLHVELTTFEITGRVEFSGNSQGIPNASVYFDNGIVKLTLQTDANGNFGTTALTSGGYEVTAVKWGYKTECINVQLSNTPILFSLNQGYDDDFATNNGWSVLSTATTGAWVRSVPSGTSYGAIPANPYSDVTNDCSNQCFVTGNAGTLPNDDDVDNGYTQVTSPQFSLSAFADPYVNYARWFFIPQNVPFGNTDTLFIRLSNGTTTAVLETVTQSTPLSSTWVNKGFRVSDFLTPSSTMSFIAYVSDKTLTGNILEAGLDQFEVSEGPLPAAISEINSANGLSVYPNPFTGQFNLHVNFSIQSEGLNVRLMDLQGRVVYTQTVFTNDVGLTPNQPIANGIYMLQVTDQNGYNRTIKLVKN